MMAQLRRIPVVISGDWQPVAYVGEVRWAGSATADEPIAALALSRTSTSVEWARAGRSQTNSFDLWLSIRSAEAPQDPKAVLITFSIQPSGARQGEGLAILQLQSSLTSDAPFMFGLDHIETGVPSWLVRIRTFDKGTVGALFVAASDTRSARNHLWHLREGVVSPDGFAEALAYGRSGKIERQAKT
jgi:hypothetical protein